MLPPSWRCCALFGSTPEIIMTTDEYRRALDAACREYEDVAQQRAELDKRLSHLHETIGALTRLCGYTPTVSWGLTDACRVVMARAEQPMTPLDVRDRLLAIGFDLTKYSSDLSAIHTVLKRLNRAGELRFVARAPGNHAYEWVKGRPVRLEQPDALVPLELSDDHPRPKPGRRRK
jgi:hypothetical protein